MATWNGTCVLSIFGFFRNFSNRDNGIAYSDAIALTAWIKAKVKACAIKPLIDREIVSLLVSLVDRRVIWIDFEPVVAGFELEMDGDDESEIFPLVCGDPALW